MDREDFQRHGSQSSSDDSLVTAPARSPREETEDSADESSSRNSNGGLLSRITLFRNNSNHKNQASLKKDKTKLSQQHSSTVQQHSNTEPTSRARSRRGSLRKTAILGLGKNRSDKEKKLHNAASESTVPSLGRPDDLQGREIGSHASPESFESNGQAGQEDDHGTGGSLRVEHQDSTTSEESLPMIHINKEAKNKHTSTEVKSESHQRQHLIQPKNTALLSAGKEENSKLKPDISLLRRRTSRGRSPLSAIPVEPIPIQEAWDYSETEWWGWVILILTWGIFVMGIGSCFEVWSWAWAVGKTPYAPPELEDDPTLPIVGYYPALIVLTGVMAWIWVFTAWVGMKYFRHAKIS